MRAQAALLTMMLAAMAVVAGEARAGRSSFVLAVQDHQLDIDTGLLDIDPVANDQTSVRGTWTWDLGDRWTVVAQGGGASSFLELTDKRLTGLTDVRVRTLYRPGPQWAIGVGTIVPLGLYELSSAEVTTAQWTWNPRSDFPLNRFGEGWGWEGTIARSSTLAPGWTAGLAFGYLRHATFSLLEDGTGDYRLGDESSFSLALDHEWSVGRRWGLQAAGRLFGADQLSGNDHVDQGDQVDLGTTLDWAGGGFSTSWGVHGTLKGDNQITAGADSVAQLSQASGHYLLLDGRIGRGLSESWLLYVAARFSRITDSDYAIGANGNTLSFGPGIGWRMSSSLALGLQYFRIDGKGQVPAPGKGTDLTFNGQDLLFTLEYRP